MTPDSLNDAPLAAMAAPVDPATAARNKLVIGLLLVSTFVVFLNETIMSVAIQPLMNDLGVTASTAQWLTTAFLLTMAVVIPITGFLLQRFNTRPIYVLAMSIQGRMVELSAGCDVMLPLMILDGAPARLIGSVVKRCDDL